MEAISWRPKVGGVGLDEGHKIGAEWEDISWRPKVGGRGPTRGLPRRSGSSRSSRGAEPSQESFKS